MRQTSEVLVPREDLPIRGTEETVGIEEKAQLRKGSDEDLRHSEQRRFSLSRFGFDKVSKASGLIRSKRHCWMGLATPNKNIP